jgi:hypothetical protein
MHGLIQSLWWRARQERELLWPLIVWSAWAQQANVVAGTTRQETPLEFFARLAVAEKFTVVAHTSGEGAALAFVRSVGVGSDSLLVGGHDI